MTSAYSTDLQLELMVTGENAGTWGDKTNTNLNLVQQAIAGYEAVSIAGGVQTTNLAMTPETISNARNAVIKFTGTITGNQTVTIPNGIEKTYILENGTTGSFTVAFKTVSGTGVTFATTDKGFKYVFSDGTNVNDIALASPPGGSDKQLQFNDSDAFGGITMGTTGQVLTTDGTTASFGDISGGTAWQAVQTSTPFTAVAGNGYFINTTSGAIEMDLPAGSIGDEISFIDYAGTFDTNALTIDPNGTEKIAGSTASLTVSVERAANTLVYTDGTQGWLLKAK